MISLIPVLFRVGSGGCSKPIYLLSSLSSYKVTWWVGAEVRRGVEIVICPDNALASSLFLGHSPFLTDAAPLLIFILIKFCTYCSLSVNEVKAP